MSEILIPYKGWVVVCDGAKALFLRNDGNVTKPDLTTVDHFSEKHLPSREIGSEKAGRVYESAGSSRSGVEIRDLHDAAEVEFLGKVAEHTDKLVREHGIESLVVVAPKKALGHLRGMIKPAVKAVVKHEVPKDLTKMSVADITENLCG